MAEKQKKCNGHNRRLKMAATVKRAEDNVTVRLSAFLEFSFSSFFFIISEFHLLFLLWFCFFFVFILHQRSLSLFIVLYRFFLATVFICLFRDLLIFLPSFPFFFFRTFHHSFTHCSVLFPLQCILSFVRFFPHHSFSHSYVLSFSVLFLVCFFYGIYLTVVHFFSLCLPSFPSFFLSYFLLISLLFFSFYFKLFSLFYSSRFLLLYLCLFFFMLFPFLTLFLFCLLIVFPSVYYFLSFLFFFVFPIFILYFSPTFSSF